SAAIGGSKGAAVGGGHRRGESVARLDCDQIDVLWKGEEAPRTAVGGQQHGSAAADDPAHSRRRGEASEKILRRPARQGFPRGTAIRRPLNRSGCADPPPLRLIRRRDLYVRSELRTGG